MEGYLEIMVRVVVLGAALFVPMHVAKRPLGSLLRREPDRWELRGIAVLLGLLAGLVPGLFPAALEMAYRALLGAAAGALCTVSYAAARARAKSTAPEEEKGGEGGAA